MGFLILILYLYWNSPRPLPSPQPHPHPHHRRGESLFCMYYVITHTLYPGLAPARQLTPALHQHVNSPPQLPTPPPLLHVSLVQIFSSAGHRYAQLQSETTREGGTCKWREYCTLMQYGQSPYTWIWQFTAIGICAPHKIWLSIVKLDVLICLKH